MSYLRLFAMLVGFSGIILSFVNYRGVRWKRSNFAMSAFVSSAILIVGINPNVVNFLPKFLNLQDSDRGRLLALMLLAIMFLFYLVIEYRGKIVILNRQFDRALRQISLNSLPADYRVYIKPIMVLIPAYNEADNLEILLKKIPESIDNKPVGCLVVDDGSDDGTQDVVKKHGYLCVRNLVNRGQGSASRLGYEILKKEKIDTVVTLDADNQHDPEEIRNLIKPILNGHSHMVIGSRRLGSEQSESIVRSIGVKVLTSIINFITGTRLTDCSSGYKAFSLPALNKIDLYEDQYQSTEVIISAAKQGLLISEVPITFALREHGETKKGTNWQYGYRFIKVLIKSWWR